MRTEYRLTVWLMDEDFKLSAANGGLVIPIQPGTTEVLLRRDNRANRIEMVPSDVDREPRDA